MKEPIHISSGLMVMETWVNKLLVPVSPKTWELRGSRTNKRGWVGLIQSGSGLIVGIGKLAGFTGPLSLEQYLDSAERHKVHDQALPYKRTFAWVFEATHRLTEPIPYVHPPGAVIWVNLDLVLDPGEKCR